MQNSCSIDYPYILSISNIATSKGAGLSCELDYTISFWSWISSSYPLFERILPKLYVVVGVVLSVMLKFVRTSKPISDKYPNWPKNHKLKGFVLVEEDLKVVRWGANAISVFVFTHANFPDKKSMLLSNTSMWPKRVQKETSLSELRIPSPLQALES